MKTDHLFLAVFIPLTCVVLLLALFSLEWRVAYDTSVLLYEAYLIDHHGYVPYRDFWDINLPGTHLVHILIGRFAGYTDGFRLRLFDIAYLAALLSVTGLWLRRLGWKVAWAATALFALIYLFTDYRLLLQREYLALLPIMAGVVTATSFPRLHDGARSALVGLAFGVVATFKPHLALALPVVLFFGYLEMAERGRAVPRTRRHLLLLLACAAAGFCLPLLAALCYLLATGALSALLAIIRNFYPLYGQVTSTLDVVPPGPERVRYVLRMFLQFGGHILWFVPASVGLFAVFFTDALDRKRRRRVLLLCALTGIYAVYPALTGQFFEYHWLPFLFFLLALGALCFVDQPGPVSAFTRWFPPLLGVMAIALRFDLVPAAVSVLEKRYVEGMRSVPPRGAAIDAIADYLRNRMLPGDKVQALDWVDGGVLQAMLEARVETATPYLTDMVFYYAISDPYVHALREDFIRRLRIAPPRFIVEFKHAPWLGGPEATSEFPELRRFIEENYRIGAELGTHRIYERVRS